RHLARTAVAPAAAHHPPTCPDPPPPSPLPGARRGPYTTRANPSTENQAGGGRALEGRDHRRRAGGAVLRTADEEGGPAPPGHRAGAQPPRRHLRLGRRLLRPDPRQPPRGRRGELPPHHREL